MKNKYTLSLALAFFMLFSCGFEAYAASGKLHRFGTYNIRYMNKEDNQADNFKSWHNRYLKVAELILKYDFDIIGLQEVTGYNNGDPQRVNKNTGKSQLDDMKDNLKGYDMVAWEREGNDYQYKLIAWKADKYEKIEEGYIGLSPEGKIGSQGWDPQLYPIKRRAGWIKFRDKATGEEFIYCVTHMNYGASLDGIYGNRLLASSLVKIAGNLPVVLVGDFNMRRNDHEKSYRGCAAYLDDACLTADVNECLPVENGQTDKTATEWTTMANPSKLKGSEFDYVFGRNINFKERHILTDYYDYNGEPAQPSDHMPILVICSLRDPRGQMTWHVSPAGSDAGDGTAATPLKTISAALAKAQSGDEIRLAEGSYDEALTIDKSVTIAGGYDASFTRVNTVSVLDGSDKDNVISVPKYFNLTLKDLEISGWTGKSADKDGAIHFAGNDIRLERIHFKNNTAFQTGGAVYAACNGFTAVGCTFENNEAKNAGAAIWLNAWADARFDNCFFTGNTAPTGAAVYATSDAADPTHIEYTCARNLFNGCSFTDNRCTKNGTVALDGKLANIRSVFINCTFANNSLQGATGLPAMTRKYGGTAISASLTDKGSHNCHNSTLEMAHCTVVANTATFKGSNKANFGGAAINTSGGETSLVNNIFAVNVTEAANGNADVVADAAKSVRNIYSANGSISYNIGMGDMYAVSADEAMALLDLVKDGDVVKANLSTKEGFTPAVVLKGTSLGSTAVNTITKANRNVEQIFGIDLNGDGLTSDILSKDQFGNARNEKTMPGAMEYGSTNGIPSLSTNGSSLSVHRNGNNTFIITGLPAAARDCRAYSLDGRCVAVSQVTDNTASMTLNVSPGIYILHTVSGKAKILVR